MTWLIIIVLHASTPAVHEIEFSSMTNCQLAANKAQIDERGRKVYAFCAYK